MKVGDGDVITVDWTGEKIEVTLKGVVVAEAKGDNVFSEGAKARVDLQKAGRLVAPRRAILRH